MDLTTLAQIATILSTIVAILTYLKFRESGRNDGEEPTIPKNDVHKRLNTDKVANTLSHTVATTRHLLRRLIFCCFLCFLLIFLIVGIGQIFGIPVETGNTLVGILFILCICIFAFWRPFSIWAEKFAPYLIFWVNGDSTF